MFFVCDVFVDLVVDDVVEFGEFVFEIGDVDVVVVCGVVGGYDDCVWWCDVFVNVDLRWMMFENLDFRAARGRARTRVWICVWSWCCEWCVK